MEGGQLLQYQSFQVGSNLIAIMLNQLNEFDHLPNQKFVFIN